MQTGECLQRGHWRVRLEMISILAAQASIELRVRLEVQGKNASTGGTIFVFIPFESMSSTFPGPILTELTPDLPLLIQTAGLLSVAENPPFST